MNILSIDTSCDETSVSVTNGLNVLSNTIWSQASLHAKWGGVFPSLAKRSHEEHIDWTVNEALKKAGLTMKEIDVIAVTKGPGLAIALEVGIIKARKLVLKHKIPLVAVNHIEGHLLSSLANRNLNIKFPALGIVISGKHTDIILVEKIGKYKILASTMDDALGEALDKAARMLGLGYPGGAILEKMAQKGDPQKYSLPTPLEGQAKRLEFSYSGIKTAMYRLTESEKPLTKTKIEDLSAVFQDKAFKHIENVLKHILLTHHISDILLGGGVSSNLELRKRLRRICKQTHAKLHIPYSKRLCTDNAAMIGIVAYYKFKEGKVLNKKEVTALERQPRLLLED